VGCPVTGDPPEGAPIGPASSRPWAGDLEHARLVSAAGRGAVHAHTSGAFARAANSKSLLITLGYEMRLIDVIK
jgi:hypothetical protein